MLKLCKLLSDGALWRRGPQDVPASRAFALGVLALYLVLSVLHAPLESIPVRIMLFLTSLEILMLSACLWCVLALFECRARFTQTFTAALGLYVLSDAASLVVQGMQTLMGTSAQQLQPSLALGVVITIPLSLGHILMRATEPS